jgi:hypothetical protein
MTIDGIKTLPMVASANPWKDRIYINLKGNGGNYAGERSAKIFVKNNKINVERGKGLTTSEWEQQLRDLSAMFA